MLTCSYNLPGQPDDVTIIGETLEACQQRKSMTPLKLGTIALGLASICIGYWLTGHHATGGASVVGVGTLLLGWALPELGAKADK